MPKYFAFIHGCRVRVSVSIHAQQRIHESQMPLSYFQEALASGRAQMVCKMSEDVFVINIGTFDMVLDCLRMVIVTVIPTTPDRKHCNPPKLGSLLKQKVAA